MRRRVQWAALVVTALAFAWIAVLPTNASAQAAPKAAPQAQQRLILAFGDSLTAGYELPPSDSFPAQLEAALRRQGMNVRVHNAGVSGDTTTGGRARLGWVLASLKAKPDLVILGLGANDALRGVDPKATRANLDAMVRELRKRGIPVLISGMLSPPNMGSSYAREFNAIFPDLARQHGATLYPFFLDGVAANPKLNLSDGIHPNRQGIALIVQRMMPTVTRSLGPSRR
jgi:acyl-CoA thioesterase-1